MSQIKKCGVLSWLLAAGIALGLPGLVCGGTVTGSAVITSDADSGISSSNTYTHALDFGTVGTAPTIDSVAFTKAGTSGTNWTLAGATLNTSGTTGSIGVASDQQMYTLLYDFNYGGNPATLTLTGLTPGTQYDLRLYYRQWGGNRTNALAFNDGAGNVQAVTINEDADTSAHYLQYTYVATGTSMALTTTVASGAGSWHFYGLTNQLGDTVPTWQGTTDSDWDNADNWLPAAVPDAAGEFVVFGSAGSNGTVDLGSAGKTVGDVTFLGSVDTTIGSTFGQTLTMDNTPTGGSAVINAAGTNAVTANLALNSNLSVGVAGASDTLTISGVIANGVNGAASLTKSGDGTLILSSATANTYTGSTAINGGTLAIAGSSTLGAGGGTLTITNGATLDLGGTTQTVYDVGASGSGNGIVGDIENGTLAVTSAMYVKSGTISADLTAPDGNNRLWIGGDTSATVVLSGNNTMHYGDTHTTIIGHSTTGSAGTVMLGSPNALGPIGDQTQVFTGVLDLNGQANVRQDSIQLGGTGAYLVNNNTTQTASFSGATGVILSANANLGGAGNLTLGSPITGAGGFTKMGAGTLLLNASSSYSGDTVVAAGTLKLGAPNVLPDGSGKGNVTVSGVLDLAGNSETINGLSGFGTVDSTAAGTPVLTVGNANADSRFGGVIQNTAGTLSLVKTGSGTLTLGGVNTYSGSTTISGGTLRLGGAAPTVQNGDFESPAISSNSYVYYASMSAAQQADFVWTSAGGALVNNSTAWGYTMPYPSGSQAFSLQRASTLSESLYFLPGTYTISWSQARRGSQVNPYYFQLDGVDVGSVISASSTAWSTASVTFTIDTAGTYSIGFRGTTTASDYSVALDSIVITGGGQLPSGTDVDVTAAGASLDLNDQYQTIASLSGVAGSTVTLGSGVLTVAGSNSTTFAGVISDTGGGSPNTGGGLVRQGSGTLTLAGDNTYTGLTDVQSGTLLVDGSVAGDVQVNGGTLGGSGTISGVVTVNDTGTLAPGNSAGILTLENGVTFTLGSTFEVELDGPAAGTQYDQLRVTAGLVDLGDELATLSVLLGDDPAVNTTFTIIDNQGTDAVQGIFAGLPEGTEFDVTYSGGSQPFVISYVGGDGNNVVLTAVPEPSTLAMLLGLALIGLLGWRRSRGRTSVRG